MARYKGLRKDIGIGFGGAAIWTPAIGLGANGVWGSGWGDESDFTPNAQPTDTDWNMEAAGTADYTALNAATLTKSAASPHGGSQALRVAYNGTAYPGAVQSPFVIGNTYYFSVWCRGDGSKAPRFSLAGVADYNGTASTSWQQLTGTSRTGAGFILYALATGAGWCEFDDMAFANRSLAQADFGTAKGTLASAALAQATAASMGWRSATTINGLYVIEFDGTADNMVDGLAASVWSGHKAAGQSIAVVCKPDATGAATDTLFDQCNGNASNHGWTLDYDTAAETVRLLVANGSGTFAVNDTAAMAKGAAHVVTASWSSAGYSLQVDGNAAVTGAITGALSASDASATLNVGRKSGGSDFFKGLIGEPWIRLGASQSDANNMRDYLRTEYGI